jgi:hypothetical protein
MITRRSVVLTGLVMGCATLATEAGDIDAVRPNAGAGPFRPITESELGAAGAPGVLRQKAAASRFRQASALALGEGQPGRVALYIVAEQAGVHGIYRFVAADARSFVEPDPPGAVLVPSEGWEGAELAQPEVVRVGGEIWLYYAAAGGIGLARSPDGISFSKQPGPVLAAEPGSSWEAGEPPRSPGFVELGADDFRLFYAAAGRIGEARSTDGVSWQRDPEPVLEPAPLAGEPLFDSLQVSDPEPELAASAQGRRITRVYYAGQGAESSGIGLAARFGDSGALQRALAPSLTTSRGPSDPALVRFGDLALMYFTQKAGASAAQAYPVIALALAPATLTLPPALPNP